MIFKVRDQWNSTGQLAVARFPSIRDQTDLNRVEVLKARLAKAVGIDVVDVRLAHPVFDPYALSLRFDRGPGGGRKLFLSARSLLLAEEDDAVDYFDLLNAMRVCCKDFSADAQQLWSRLLFGVLMGHKSLDLRKIRYFYAGNVQWRLARAHGLRLAFFESGPSPAAQLACQKQILTPDAMLATSDAFEVTSSIAQARLSQQLEVIAGRRRLAAEFSVNMHAQYMEISEKRSRIGAELLRRIGEQSKGD